MDLSFCRPLSPSPLLPLTTATATPAAQDMLAAKANKEEVEPLRDSLEGKADAAELRAALDVLQSWGSKVGGGGVGGVMLCMHVRVRVRCRAGAAEGAGLRRRHGVCCLCPADTIYCSASAARCW